MSLPTLSAIPPVTRYFVFVAFSLGTAFAFINDPEQSGALPLVSHFVQWQLQTLIPIGLLMLVQRWVSRLPLRLTLGPWISLVSTGVVASLLFAPIALGVDWLFLGDPYSVTELLDELTGMAPPVIVCWVAMNAPIVLGFRLERGATVDGDSQVSPKAPVSDPVADVQPVGGMVGAGDATPYPAQESTGEPAPMDAAFFQEIPEDCRGELVYLKAELHYLSVVTTQGSALILYNLRDAMAQLPTTMGMQVHRGFWVAFDQVQRLERAGRQGTLWVSNGDSVPVSRTRLSAVQERLDGRLPDVASSAA